MHRFYKDPDFWFYYTIHRLETVRVRYAHQCDNPVWYVADLNITYYNGLADYSQKTLVCGKNHIATTYSLLVYPDKHENYTDITMIINAKRIGVVNHLVIKINNRKSFKWIVDDDITNDIYYKLKLEHS